MQGSTISLVLLGTSRITCDKTRRVAGYNYTLTLTLSHQGREIMFKFDTDFYNFREMLTKRLSISAIAEIEVT